MQGISKFLSWKFKTSTVTGAKNARRIDLAALEKLAADYLTGEHDYAGDLVRYAAYLAGKYAPLSQKTYISPVRQFLLLNDIELRDSQKAAIRKKLPRGYHPRSRDEPFTLEWARKICDNAPLRVRALILVLLSSGMRLSEALQIVEADINFEVSPVTVHLRDSYTKTRAPRDVYLSGEAVAALKEWIAARGDYLKEKSRYAENLKRTVTEDDPRIFPFTREATERIFNAALLKVYCRKERGENGERLPIKDRETGRSPIHLHGLRKTFRIELSKAETPRAIDITEHLMGHAGYLGGTYQIVPDEEARTFYLENEHRLMIHPPALTDKDREEMKNLAQENTELREKLTRLEKFAEEERVILTFIQNTPEFKAIVANYKK